MLTVEPAKLTDLSSVKPLVSARKLAFLTVQMQMGKAWRLDWRGEPAGLVGLVGVAGVEADEFWMVLAKNLRDSDRREAGLFSLACVHRFRAMTHQRPILAAVKSGHVPGERMAAMAGFIPAQMIEGTTIMYWVFLP